MAKTAPVGREPVGIGRRARVIRRHRGLSLDVVAGLARIAEDHLSMLESGARRFGGRGLVEDLANAIGCGSPICRLIGRARMRWLWCPVFARPSATPRWRVRATGLLCRCRYLEVMYR
ncbi:MAG: helix-turn-helix domain-containing protein [Pseudonocardiaceae bacterium]